MPPVCPLLPRYGLDSAFSLSGVWSYDAVGLRSIEADQSTVPDPRPVFHIGPDSRHVPVSTIALLARRFAERPVVDVHVGERASRFTHLDSDLYMFGGGEVDGGTPARPPNGRHGVMVFREGDTIASFIADKSQQTFYLGINPETGFLEAHDSTVTHTPEYCRIKLETQSLEQGPAFSFWDPDFVTGTSGWVSFGMKDWDFSRNGKSKAESVIKSLFSFTLSIMAGREFAVIDVRLPKAYKDRVHVLYNMYRDYLKAGFLPYFQEMLRLSERRDGRLNHCISIEPGVGGKHEENLADFAERIAVTMGLDRFILSIFADGTLAAVENVDSVPPGAWNFLLTQVSKGAFTVKRKTSAGNWELVNPRVYHSHSNIVAILLGQEAFLGGQSFLGLERADIGNPETRKDQVSWLLTLAIRGADYADLQAVIATNPDSVADCMGRLLEFSAGHPHYMDFLSRVPNLDESQPEIRFISAVNQIYTALFALLLHRTTGTRLGTYGHYYLRYALRVYVSERVQRDFAGFVTSGGTLTDSLNLFSSQLLGLRGRLDTPRSVQRELSGIPIAKLVTLAVSYKDQAEFVEGSLVRINFTTQAQKIARKALYPFAPDDEPLN